VTKLRVLEVPHSRTLWRLEIYDGNELIGEFEKSALHHIARKKREVRAATEFLRNIYRKNGAFQVRWDGKARQKSVRVQGIEVAVIPETFWK
jgi:hypothetical protein